MIAYMCVCVGCVLMNSYFGLSTGTYMCRHTFGSQRTTLGVSPHIFFCDTVYCFATEYPGLAVSHLPPGTLGLQMNDTTPSLMCVLGIKSQVLTYVTNTLPSESPCQPSILAC